MSTPKAKTAAAHKLARLVYRMIINRLPIAPARFPHATLDAASSETDETTIAFRDERRAKEFSAAWSLVGQRFY